MDDQLELLGALMNMTQEQQATIAEAIKNFERQNEKLEKSSDDLLKVVQTTLTHSVASAVQQSMENSAKSAQTTFESAINPLLENVNASIKKASQERQQLNQARGSFAGILSVLGLATSASIAAVYLTIWWNQAALDELRIQKVEMEKNILNLRKRKGDVRFSLCGKKQRPCVEVEREQGYGNDKDHIYFILKGVR